MADMPAWKRRHLEEQERRLKEEQERLVVEKEEKAKRDAERASAEAEAERLRHEEAERKKREQAEAELRQRESEAELKKQMFLGTKAKAEREEILKEVKAPKGLTSPRKHEAPAAASPAPQDKNLAAQSKGNLPAWKVKQLEEEERRKKQLEEEAKKKAEAIANLPPVFEVQK